MGLIKITSTARNTSQGSQEIPQGNPNPARFKIVSVESVNNFLIVVIDYPDCNNFEGKKILVYLNVTEAKIRKLAEIDPHFTSNDFSPIARFEPTVLGLKMARFLCHNY